MAPPPYRFTMYDLNSCLGLAKTLKDAGQASAEELAVFLDYKSANNGAFLTRMANARLFGLIDGSSALLRPTQRAIDILQPDYEATAARARLEAFESVPLYHEFLNEYHAKTLPDATGMKNALETRWLISADKSAMVLARLLESAKQAGLFAAASDRMIRPTPRGGLQRPSAVITPTESESRGDEGAVQSPSPVSVRSIKMIDGVLDMLPNEPRWDEASLTHWLRFFEDALRIYYKMPKPDPASSNGAKTNGAAVPRATAERSP